eukprot:TRINITY_DN18523_c0_g1_i1.p1 TRINITY_DN18523_c0_g1~~TRINITY_DN18523_c0_g1_i1.p1  ORF type:complete len:201 (-),score=50.11 TRINITY_DN18523_c0_g1_i1:253-855(-)
MIRRPPRSTLSSSSAASDVYKRQGCHHPHQPPPAAAPQSSQEDKDTIARLQRQNDAQKKEIERLQEELDAGSNELGSEFDFGRRVYQCVIPNPGVGYRVTPKFGDKRKDGCGPQAPQVIIADAVCQGPSAIFVREAASEDGTEGRGWLPLTNPAGDKVCFQHLGTEAELKENGKLAECDIAQGKVKVKKAQDAWFSPKQD